MVVKSEQVNGADPIQIKTKRPTKKDAAPRMPHERDESDDSQSSPPREDMQQAYKDVMQGQQDTDNREGRGLEEVVRKTPNIEADKKRAAAPEKVIPKPDEIDGA